MQERFDLLIAVPAAWLFEGKPWASPARAGMTWMLGFGRTLALTECFRDRPTGEIMEAISHLLARDVAIRGLDNIPRRGPALTVTNHPMGIIDVSILNHALRSKSEDGIGMLRRASLAPGGRYAPTVSLADMTRPPTWARHLRI